MASDPIAGLKRVQALLQEALELADAADETLVAALISEALAAVDDRQHQRD